MGVLIVGVLTGCVDRMYLEGVLIGCVNRVCEQGRVYR